MQPRRTITPMPPESDLRRRYLDMRLSLRQIAREDQVSHQTVKRWLTRAGIPIRHRHDHRPPPQPFTWRPPGPDYVLLHLPPTADAASILRAVADLLDPSEPALAEAKPNWTDSSWRSIGPVNGDG